jgi:hypothetical protein
MGNFSCLNILSRWLQGNGNSREKSTNRDKLQQKLFCCCCTLGFVKDHFFEVVTVWLPSDLTAVI